MRWLAGLLVFLIAALAFAQFMLPRLVERAVAEALEERLGPGETLRVQLKAYPTLRMLLGQFDSIAVEARQVRALGEAGVLIDRLRSMLYEVRVDMQALLRERELVITRSRQVNVEMEISESSLNQYLWLAFPELEGMKFKLETGRAVLEGEVTLAGISLQVRTVGQFVGMDESKVGYRVQELEVEGFLLPKPLRDKVIQILGGEQMFFDLAKAPLPVVVREVKNEEGRLIIIGEAKGD